MTRAEIIELIQNKYDRTPDHLPPNSGWDDGTGEIADTICARITELEAELSTAKAEIERVWAIAKGLDRFADGHELSGKWLEELKALKSSVR